jgi:hypothetical protein
MVAESVQNPGRFTAKSPENLGASFGTLQNNVCHFRTCVLMPQMFPYSLPWTSDYASRHTARYTSNSKQTEIKESPPVSGWVCSINWGFKEREAEIQICEEGNTSGFLGAALY